MKKIPPPADGAEPLQQPSTEQVADELEAQNPLMAAPLPPPPEEPAAHPEPELPVGWTRPKPLQRDSNVRAWLFFFAGICLIVAAWVPLRAMYQRLRYKPAVEGGYVYRAGVHGRQRRQGAGAGRSLARSV